MCGRYAASRRPEDLVEEFEIAAVVGEVLPPSYNVAPTDSVYVVAERRAGNAAEAHPVRELRVARWGLVPPWASNPAIGTTMINARLETVAVKPAFRSAFARQRCLVPADGYFEWFGDQKGAKQPFFIHPADGGVLAMAGLYELWRDRSRREDDPRAWLHTCSIITTRALDDLGHIHDRMPMLVERGCYDEWLDPSVGETDHLRALLTPAAPGRLVPVPVSKDVGNVGNNGPHLVEPVSHDLQQQLF